MVFPNMTEAAVPLRLGNLPGLISDESRALRSKDTLEVRSANALKKSLTRNGLVLPLMFYGVSGHGYNVCHVTLWKSRRQKLKKRPKTWAGMALS